MQSYYIGVTSVLDAYAVDGGQLESSVTDARRLVASKYNGGTLWTNGKKTLEHHLENRKVNEAEHEMLIDICIYVFGTAGFSARVDKY